MRANSSGDSISPTCHRPLNQHPRSAMAFKASDKADKFLKFYDEIVQDV